MHGSRKYFMVMGVWLLFEFTGGSEAWSGTSKCISFNWKIRNWYWYFSVESFYSIIRSCLNSHYQLFCGSTAKLINIILYLTESSCHTRHYEVESTYTVFFYRITFVKASLVCNCDIVWIFPVYFCHMH